MGKDPREHGCCRRCREEWEAQHQHLPFGRLLARRMSICPTCGSKRCQRADDHSASCSPVRRADRAWTSCRSSRGRSLAPGDHARPVPAARSCDADPDGAV